MSRFAESEYVPYVLNWFKHPTLGTSSNLNTTCVWSVQTPLTVERNKSCALERHEIIHGEAFSGVMKQVGVSESHLCCSYRKNDVINTVYKCLIYVIVFRIHNMNSFRLWIPSIASYCTCSSQNAKLAVLSGGMEGWDNLSLLSITATQADRRCLWAHA